LNTQTVRRKILKLSDNLRDLPWEKGLLPPRDHGVNLNINHFEKVDEPKRGGGDNVDKVILFNLGTFDAFLAILIRI
jgi:hypothetical protein